MSDGSHKPMKLRAALRPDDVSVVVDNREQLPWDLSPLRMVRGTLQTGDYGLLAAPDAVAVERKSLPDLLGCCTNGRDRFERELERLRAFPARAVIVEASWQDLEAGCWHVDVPAKSVTGSILRWTADGVPFLFPGDREKAQLLAARLLFMVAKKIWRQARALAVDVMEGPGRA